MSEFSRRGFLAIAFGAVASLIGIVQHKNQGDAILCGQSKVPDFFGTKIIMIPIYHSEISKVRQVAFGNGRSPELVFNM